MYKNAITNICEQLEARFYYMNFFPTLKILIIDVYFN